MGKYQSQRIDIVNRVAFMDGQLKALASKMRAYPNRWRADCVLHLPFREQGEVDEAKEVVVTKLEGPDALDHAAYGLTALYLNEGPQNPRETLRVPGVIALPSTWIKDLQDINVVRSEIKGLIEQIDDLRERPKVWSSITLLSGLQVLRKTRIVDGPKKITFFWDSAPSVLSKPANEWIDHYTEFLTEHYGYVPRINDLDEGDKSRKYILLIDRLRSSCEPDEQIAAFRHGQPHVRARITFHDSKPYLLRPAPTPIVYELGDSVPTVIPLSNWEPEVVAPKRETRKQTISTEPVVDGLWFYRYLKATASVDP
ncbi:DNA replication terminus site-binding protein [Pseudomonas putida]|uniref:DNA replication terminus site-binding protein n=1 Tax=Pseudomonas putida TaxID=303 RepID=UPI0023632953|nr:DNA replication terminus site-binding protein [Pseudomonas putida]MDD2139560.1 DNA replication terminus site-binding protein [Pseudomonas putida]